jgi:menaquinone-dependent protoporphyrinogen oxidase
MGNGILVAYASNSGSTAEVAKVIGEELAHAGAQVDVRPIGQVAPADLSGYDAVVVGAPMILGWHRDAERFVKANRSALSKVPTAIFITALRLTKTDDAPPEGVPVYVDPKLAKPPQKPGRLSLKERYARLNNYLGPVLKAAGPVRPVSIAFFDGRLDMRRLKFLQMLFIMLIVGAQPGDFRNWDAIRGWARDVRGKLA